LSFQQDDVRWNGHAIECRVYAEDPDNSFLPSPGRITFLRVPGGPGIRDDSGVAERDEVSIYYDPMISKLIAWGRTRSEAIDRMRRALDEYAVGGIKTTLPFFREIVRDEEFIEAKLDTGFIPRFNERRARTRSANASELCDLRRDVAIIAGGLAYADAQRAGEKNHRPSDQSKWKIAGRTAAVNQTRVKKNMQQT